MNRLTRLVSRFNSPESKLLLLRFTTKLSPLCRQFSTDSGRVRKILPEELRSKNVVALTCRSSSAKGTGVCDVYLVGTCHISAESCREVEAVISYLKPEVVFLELCMHRVGVLRSCQTQNLKVLTMKEKMQILWQQKDENPLRQLIRWSYTSVYEEKGVIPCSDFRVAYEEALKYGGKVMLGDRPVQITYDRLWTKMSVWQKIKLPFSLISLAAFFMKNITQKRTSGNMPFWQKFMPFSLFSQANFPSTPLDFEKMIKVLTDDSDLMHPLMNEMNKKMPIFAETFVHERDLYMATGLLNVASKHSSVVAVVGMLHLQGIKKHWQELILLKDLQEIPSHKAAVTGACKDT